MEDNNSKEINLLQLITLFFDWLKMVFKGIINAIGQIIKLSFRHKTILVIVIAMSVIVGQYMARKSARIYKAEAMAMIYGSDAQTVKEVTRQLENSLSTNNLISLATKLSLPDSVAKNIAEISSYYVIDYLKDDVADIIDFDNNHSLSDTLNLRMVDRIYLRIKTRNINQIAKVENAILNYFNNNEILKKHLDSKRDELKQQIKICNSEMLRLDSLAKVTYFSENNKQLQFDNNKLIIGKQEKQLFYNDLIYLQSFKSKSEKDLSEIELPVQFLSGLVVNPTPLNGRVKYGVTSLFVGFAIALIIAFFIENTDKIWSFLNRK